MLTSRLIPCSSWCSLIFRVRFLLFRYKPWKKNVLWNGSTCGNKFCTMYSTLGLPVFAGKHRVVAGRDHLLPRRSLTSFKRPSRADPTKLMNEPGLFEIFSKSFPAESSRVPGGPPSFAARTPYHIFETRCGIREVNYWPPRSSSERKFPALIQDDQFVPSDHLANQDSPPI